MELFSKNLTFKTYENEKAFTEEFLMGQMRVSDEVILKDMWKLALVGYWLSIVLMFSAPEMGIALTYVYVFIMYTLINSAVMTFLNCNEAVYLATVIDEPDHIVTLIAVVTAVPMTLLHHMDPPVTMSLKNPLTDEQIQSLLSDQEGESIPKDSKCFEDEKYSRQSPVNLLQREVEEYGF